MTLAQLYNHLSTKTDYFSRPEGNLALIMANPVIPVRSESEAWQYARCMLFDPCVLREANHAYAYEICAAFSIIMNSVLANPRELDWVYWVARKLQSYTRFHTTLEILHAFTLIHPYHTAFEDVPLQLAISKVIVLPITPAHRHVLELHSQTVLEGPRGRVLRETYFEESEMVIGGISVQRKQEITRHMHRELDRIRIGNNEVVSQRTENNAGTP